MRIHKIYHIKDLLGNIRETYVHPEPGYKECLTGAYFPQDTILGKKILEQCHGKTNIPFWQQYTRPAIYHHLLIDNITRDK